MKIRVTREDIRRANRLKKKAEAEFNGSFEASYFCPIALAVKRQTHKAVDVGQEDLSINYIDYTLPQSASEFIQDFDIGIEVTGFTFETERI